MKKLWNLLMKGLAAVLPLGLTIYIVYWLGSKAESIMHRLITWVLPESYYWPGLGLIVGFGLLLIAGLVVNAYLVRLFLATWERFLGHIPLVKTVYAAIRDLVKFLPAAGKRRDLRSVVVATFGSARAIGFITRDKVPEMAGLPNGANIVAVYFPMSYQIGGYTLYLQRDQLTPLDMGVEDAMRLQMTGGMSAGNSSGASKQN